MFNLIISNFPLLCGIIAIILAQLLKVIIRFFVTKQWDWRLLSSSGNMPSSHTSGVTALAFALAIQEGLDSPLFAIAAIFAFIVMYDATGVRRQSGKHSIMINQLIRDFNRLIEEMRTWSEKDKVQKQEELLELLGHEPSEVLAGAILGVFTTFLLYIIML